LFVSFQVQGVGIVGRILFGCGRPEKRPMADAFTDGFVHQSKDQTRHVAKRWFTHDMILQYVKTHNFTWAKSKKHPTKSPFQFFDQACASLAPLSLALDSGSPGIPLEKRGD
jgi:hypothetical protein